VSINLVEITVPVLTDRADVTEDKNTTLGAFFGPSASRPSFVLRASVHEDCCG
jgi:hypothetical protein